MSPKPAKLPELTAASGPVEIVKTDWAYFSTHFHTALVLSAYYLSSTALISDPVATLLKAVLPLTIIQVSYAVKCLPAAGGAAGHVAKSSQRQIPRRRPAGRSQDGLSRTIVPGLLAAILSLILGTPILAVLMVLFGAPLTSHLPHTLLAASHLAILSLLPLIYVHGVESNVWKRIIAAHLPLDEVFGAMVGTLVGAWFGAVPIPLDWDREWQKWPVTIVAGAYGGWALGKLVGGTLLRGRMIEFGVSEEKDKTS
ncbi:MAG: Glycosylphosphatidylinositol (GPI) anchor assembly protein [Caeruleum heppii]|nr:MAG: Glycosylphosphatidylinositol (GPI) anchor assembly protein [Caeruleum heppii]